MYLIDAEQWSYSARLSSGEQEYESLFCARYVQGPVLSLPENV